MTFQGELKLVKILIKETEIDQDLIEFKNNGFLYKDSINLEDMSDPSKLLKKNWSTFLKISKYRICTMRCFKFVNEHADWCMFKIFSKMYNFLYESFEKSKHAIHLDTAQRQ